MSAPLIWIVFPGAASLFLWFTRRKIIRTTVLAALLCLLLGLLAIFSPLGQRIALGPLSFQIQPELSLVGRKFILENTDRPLLAFIYFLCAFWFIGNNSAGATNLFIPLGLGMVSLLTASLSVEPFLYAALLIEMAVLLAVPILAAPGTSLSQGVLRFLIFQTLGMPFILLAGWAMAGVEANPGDLALAQLAVALLGLGFAFWLAVFPFYTWIPLLAEQAFPYTAGFVFFIFPTISLLLGQDFLAQFGWIRAAPQIFQVIGQIGLLMILTAGIWAAFQKDLARLFGYAFIIEAGFSLLAISLFSSLGQQLFAAMFLPRMLSAGLWALSLSVLRKGTQSTRFEDVVGISQQFPIAAAGLAVASLTMAGFPLLGLFPVRLALLEELARQSFTTSVLVLAGMVGMLFSTFRALAVLARGWSREIVIHETHLQIILLAGGMIGLVFMGLLPQMFLPLTNGLMARYVPLP